VLIHGVPWLAKSEGRRPIQAQPTLYANGYGELTGRWWHRKRTFGLGGESLDQWVRGPTSRRNATGKGSIASHVASPTRGATLSPHATFVRQQASKHGWMVWSESHTASWRYICNSGTAVPRGRSTVATRLGAWGRAGDSTASILDPDFPISRATIYSELQSISESLRQPGDWRHTPWRRRLFPPGHLRDIRPCYYILAARQDRQETFCINR
jgi:hypothetical protein